MVPSGLGLPLVLTFATVAGSVALMGAVIGRSSVSGIVVGLVWFIADTIFGHFLLGVSQVTIFSGAATSLVANSIGQAAPFGLLLSLLVMVIFLVVPIDVVAYIRDRDMVGVDMVLADGSFITASTEKHADLFWAVRGGGGNFGVVTSFLFQLHPISTVYGGPMLWPLEQATDILKFWRDFILQAPEDINGWFGFVGVPSAPMFPEQWHLQKMCAIVWCYSGPQEHAYERFQLIRANIPPAVDFAGPMPWPVLQSLFDALSPKGLQWYWKTDFFSELSDDAIDLHVKYGAQLPTMLSGMHLYPINGAVHRLGTSDTAFSFREANFAEVILGVDPDPANNECMIQWARDYWMALHPYSAGGGYVNMMMDEGADSVQAAYRDNYTRLAQIKARYDPGNLFHVNQNIKPAR